MSEIASHITDLKTTPLHSLHLELGAKMVPFAGYHMPVQYRTGVLQEHLHTRCAAGLFDVSHMGQIVFSGPNAAAALETLIPIDVMGLALNHQRYGFFTNESGGLLDDLMLVHRETHHGKEWLMVVNGACKSADLAHIHHYIGDQCHITHLEDQALLALQGPAAPDALLRICDAPKQLRFMQGGWYEADGIRMYITRSGYTGEDGFELSVKAVDAPRLAQLLLAQPEVLPIGLGARNSLRLEAGLCLYGNDLTAHTNPVNANLQWAIQKVRRQGGDRAGGFLGSAAIDAAFASVQSWASNRIDDHHASFLVRVGLVGLERIPVREPSVLVNEAGESVGTVCSGLLSPVLNQPIAMAYVPLAFASAGKKLYARVRDRLVPMQVTKIPFVPHRYLR